MSMGRRPRHNADEQDAYDRNARKLLACLQRAGIVKKTKRATHKRERHEAKIALLKRQLV